MEERTRTPSSRKPRVYTEFCREGLPRDAGRARLGGLRAGVQTQTWVAIRLLRAIVHLQLLTWAKTKSPGPRIISRDVP